MVSVLPYKTAIWLTLLSDPLCGKSWFIQAAWAQKYSCAHTYTRMHIPLLLSHTHHPQTLIGSDSAANTQWEVRELPERGWINKMTGFLLMCFWGNAAAHEKPTHNIDFVHSNTLANLLAIDVSNANSSCGQPQMLCLKNRVLKDLWLHFGFKCSSVKRGF